MQQIKNLELYVGVKEEYEIAKNNNMSIVCALNRAKGFVTHQSVVGWEGRGCNKDNVYYLFKKEEDAIYLNMIDGNDPDYVSDVMIDAALRFIKDALSNNKKVFIYCSLGESRSPSIALMYLLENNLIDKNNDPINYFSSHYYNNYQPKKGNLEYIKNRWLN